MAVVNVETTRVDPKLISGIEPGTLFRIDSSKTSTNIFMKLAKGILHVRLSDGIIYTDDDQAFVLDPNEIVTLNNAER